MVAANPVGPPQPPKQDATWPDRFARWQDRLAHVQHVLDHLPAALHTDDPRDRDTLDQLLGPLETLLERMVGELEDAVRVWEGGAMTRIHPRTGRLLVPRTPSEHEAINAREYPGTRQLCEECDAPTARCEEDSLFTEEGYGPLCSGCWQILEEPSR